MQYNAHTDRVLDIKMLNPAYLASISDDLTFRVWNYTTGQLITTFLSAAMMGFNGMLPTEIHLIQDGRILLPFSEGTVIKLKSQVSI